MLTVLSLLPLLTTGQAFGSVTLTVQNQKDFTFGAEQCGTGLGGEWLPALRGTPCTAMSLWVTSGECRDTFGDGDLVLPEVTTASLLESIGSVVPARVVRIPVDDLPQFAASVAAGGMGCGARDVEHAYRFCSAVSMSLDFGCVTQTVVRGSSATLRYDTKPPTAPVLVKAEPLDGALSVSFTTDGDAATVDVEVRGPEDEGFTVLESETAGVGHATVENLSNGFTYTVRVVAIDAIGNASAPSNEIEVTPRASMGFWGACREAGCPSDTGCSAAQGPLGLAALALLALGARRRRSRSS